MKLNEFKKVVRGRSVRLVARVPDVTGASDYEMVIVGPADVVDRAFAKSDFSVAIDPRRGTDQVEKELAAEAQRSLEEYAEVAQLTEVALLKSKRATTAPTTDNSILVSLRRIRGQGTFWIWGFPYYLMRGWSIFLYLPPLTILSASAAPINGDQDLFLRGGGLPFYPTTLMSSTRGGTAVDRIFFSTPGAWNLLLLRIFGFTSGAGAFSSWFIT
jgi:hypothetical protein